MIVFAYSYCVKKKNRSNHKYVAAVVKEWANQGLKTVSQIEDYLEETDNRHYLQTVPRLALSAKCYGGRKADHGRLV